MSQSPRTLRRIRCTRGVRERCTRLETRFACTLRLVTRARARAVQWRRREVRKDRLRALSMKSALALLTIGTVLAAFGCSEEGGGSQAKRTGASADVSSTTMPPRNPWTKCAPTLDLPPGSVIPLEKEEIEAGTYVGIEGTFLNCSYGNSSGAAAGELTGPLAVVSIAPAGYFDAVVNSEKQASSVIDVVFALQSFHAEILCAAAKAEGTPCSTVRSDTKKIDDQTTLKTEVRRVTTARLSGTMSMLMATTRTPLHDCFTLITDLHKGPGSAPTDDTGPSAVSAAKEACGRS